MDDIRSLKSLKRNIQSNFRPVKALNGRRIQLRPFKTAECKKDNGAYKFVYNSILYLIIFTITFKEMLFILE